jgi:hypothetical protein
MRADICEASDDAAIARLRVALKEMGARLLQRHNSPLGVDLYEFKACGDHITVFSDAWSVDVEGPSELVQRLVAACRVEEA